MAAHFGLRAGRRWRKTREVCNTTCTQGHGSGIAVSAIECEAAKTPDMTF